MRTIDAGEVTARIREMAIESNYHVDPAYVHKVGEAMSRETSPLGLMVLDQDYPKRGPGFRRARSLLPGHGRFHRLRRDGPGGARGGAGCWRTPSTRGFARATATVICAARW